MDDAEHEQYAVFGEDVVRHAVLTNTQPVKGVRSALNCLHGLAADPAGSGDIDSEQFEGIPDPRPHGLCELPKRPSRRGRELGRRKDQSRSRRATVWPLA